MSRTRILLVRHGETDDNRRGIFQGQAGRGLNELGRAQSVLLAERFAQAGVTIDGLYCSDQERASETAEILAPVLGCELAFVEGLREVYLGAWEGLTQAEVAERFPHEWATWQSGLDLERGGGESYAELTERMVSAVKAIAAAYAGGTALIVSHGGSIKAFAGHVLRLGVERLRIFPSLSNTGVCLVERGDDGAFRLLVWNDVAHLGDPLVAVLSSG